MDALEQLHAMLTKIGLSDDEIAGGIQIADSGRAKIAKRLGLDVPGVNLLFAKLQTRLRDQNQITEDEVKENDRFSYEVDFLENVTIRDAETGKETFLQGDDAVKFLNKVKNTDPQLLMASYEHLMEDDAEHYRAREETGFWGRKGAGCLILAQSTGRILIALRSGAVEEPGTWGTWGGAIDDDENPKDAVRREVAEEAGYHGEIERILPLLVFRQAEFAYHNFLVVVPDEFVPHLNWESHGYRWCDFGKWPRPIHFGLKALLQDRHSLGLIEAEVKDCPLDEDEESPAFRDPDTFEDEISADRGTFNFPWTIGGRHGFATASYSGRGAKMNFAIVYASDEKGKPIATGSLTQELLKQAKAFVAKA